SSYLSVLSSVSFSTLFDRYSKTKSFLPRRSLAAPFATFRWVREYALSELWAERSFRAAMRCFFAGTGAPSCGRAWLILPKFARLFKKGSCWDSCERRLLSHFDSPFAIWLGDHPARPRAVLIAGREAGAGAKNCLALVDGLGLENSEWYFEGMLSLPGPNRSTLAKFRIGENYRNHRDSVFH